MQDINKIVFHGNSEDEKETIISFVKGSTVAYIYTADNTVLTKLKKNVNANPKEWKLHNVYRSSDSYAAVEVTCPKKYISFRGKSKSREMTEEQKKAASERLKKARSVSK